MSTLPIKSVMLREFNGGMATDPRDPTINKGRYCVNFDCYTNPFKLTPYHDSESGDSAAATSHKQNFCVGLSVSTYKLFSLGVKSGTGLAEVLMKDLTTGGSGGLSDASWQTPASNQSSTGNTSFNLFTFYKTTGKIYGATTGAVWSFDAVGGGAWSDTEHSLSYTNISNGLVHSMNDILYVGYDNKITKNNAGAWTDAVLTLPPGLYITGLAEYGNYLAIIAAPLSGVGNSKVFLWDMSATTWNILVDNGDGAGKVIQSLHGTLVTVAIASDQTRLTSRVIFREYTKAGMMPFAVFEGASGDTLLPFTQVVNDRMLLMMSLTLNGVMNAGVWSIAMVGRALVVTQENTINNNTPLVAGDVLGGFFKVGDFLFQSFIVSNTWTLSKTNDASSYTATSIRQTDINEGMKGDSIELKQLVSAGLMYEPLPSGAQAVMKYRVDGGVWTTIFTETTQNAVYTEPRTNAGGTEFTLGKEYEFRAESTGGAEITGILYKYEVIPSNV